MPDEFRLFRYLLGYLTTEEAIATFRGRSAPPLDAETAVRELCASTQGAVQGLEVPRLGGVVHDLEGIDVRVLESIVGNPLFHEATANREWEFKLVDLDRLVCIQKYVDWDYASDLATRITDHSIAQLARFSLSELALPRDFWIGGESGRYASTFVSRNWDFRVVSQQLRDDPTTGRRVLSYVLGWGVPFITVVQMDSRLYLRNGYHRACAARISGANQLPVLLVHGREFSDVGIRGPGYFDEHLLRSDRPPILARFFSPEIAPEIRLKPLAKIIRVEAEEFGALGTAHVPSPWTPSPQAAGMVSEGGVAGSPYLGFQATREDWGEYRLSDGTVLRLRQVATNVRVAAGARPGERGVSVDVGPIEMATVAPSELWGPASAAPIPNEELAHSIAERGLRVTPIREMLCEYRCEDRTRVALRLTIHEVSRTTRFNTSGEPVYVVSSQPQLSVVPPNRERPRRRT